MAHTLSFTDITIKDLVKLQESGCFELFIGIESGSKRILKSIHKFSNIDTIKNNITNLFKVGINVKGYFILGFPDERKEDFEKTFLLALYLKKESLKYKTNFRVSVFQFRPYHGTELYNNIYSDNKNVEGIIADTKLSNEIGRSQFNFTSGNHSLESDNILLEYIKKINNLNNKEWKCLKISLNV